MSFEQRVDEIRKRDACSGTAALQKARLEHPDDFQRYCASNQYPALIHKGKSPEPAAVSRFMGLVQQIQNQTGGNFNRAMKTARLKYPAEFKAFQSA